MTEFMLCPDCSRAEMEADELFPDEVIWLCPHCGRRYTPRAYRKEWESFYFENLIRPFEQKKRRMRLIVLAVLLATLLMIGLIWRMFS